MANISDTRKISLDVLRNAALFSMIIAHFLHRFRFPEGDIWDFIRLAAGGAPALFFFVFGITIHRFIKKDLQMQFEMSIAFLSVALIHNLTFTGKLIHSEFFFFLWMAQLIMSVFAQTVSKPQRAGIFTVGFVLFLMILLKDGAVSNLFERIIPGQLTLFPWMLFVLSGYIYAENIFLYKSNSIYSALVFIVIAVFFHVIFADSSFSGLVIRKYPMTVPYFLLFLSMNILILAIGERYGDYIKSVPFIFKYITFFSNNLLLAAVLHYLPYLILRIILKIIHFNGIVINDFIVLLSGSILCIILLAWFMKSFLGLWNKIKDRRLFVFARRYNAIFTLIIVGIYFITVNIDSFILTVSAKQWGADVIAIYQYSSSKLSYIFMIFVMTYFSLVSGEIKRKKR